MLRRTQGELLQKLRQLRQWQQQQQEHLLQNKEKKLSFIREQEKRLQAVQDYQEKILTQSGNIGHSPHVNLTTVRNLTGGNPSFHMKTFGHGFHEIPDERPPLALQQGDFNQNFNLKSSSNLGSAGLMPPTPKAVLLSPKHFQTAVSHVEEDLDTKVSSLLMITCIV